MKIDPSAIYTMEEVADFLHKSTRTVYRRIQSGELAGKKEGKGWLIPGENLLNYMGQGNIDEATREMEEALVMLNPNFKVVTSGTLYGISKYAPNRAIMYKQMAEFIRHIAKSGNE